MKIIITLNSVMFCIGLLDRRELMDYEGNNYQYAGF